MSGAHTPGPWRFDGDWYRIPAIFGADGKHVASVEKDAREATPERAANARLIAAAPDLLKALEELHAMVVGECPSLLNEDSGGNARLDLEIRAAIAAAKGAA